MSQIPTENDNDNRSVPASDSVQLGQPDEVPAQQEAQQQHEQPQFGLHQNQDVVETKMMENLKEELAKLLSTQNEQHQQEKAELEAKNRKLGEKSSSVELQTTENGALDTKMEQLKGEFSKLVAEQQKQWMAQFQAQHNSLEQKLKEAEQRAQMEKNELEEAIRANQQKMEKFRQEMEETGKQAIERNQKKLDHIWGQLVVKSKIVANPRGIVWNGLNTGAVISKCGLKVSGNRKDEQWVFATEGYAISGEHCRKENFQFPGTIVYYFEVTTTESLEYSSVGFTDGSQSGADHVGGGGSSNSYGLLMDGLACWLSGKTHELQSNEAFDAGGTVFGCGLLLNSKNELAVFFTHNGILMGKHRITPTVDRLYPTVVTFRTDVEANFGDNLVAKPFKYNIDKCPGLVFE